MRTMRKRSIVKCLITTIAVLTMFVGTAMACGCIQPESTTGEPVYMTQVSSGDPVPTFVTNEGENGLLPDEDIVLNPITFHQPDVNFAAYYAANEANGPCDMWPTTE